MRIQKRHRRAAVPPIEFILVAPLLAVLIICICWLAAGGFFKSQAVTQARQLAWNARAEADAGTPFKLDHDPLTSLVDEKVRVELPGPAPFSTQAGVAVSYAGVIARFWDEDDVEFSTKIKNFEPHLEPLKLLAKNVRQQELFGQLPYLAQFKQLVLFAK